MAKKLSLFEKIMRILAIAGPIITVVPSIIDELKPSDPKTSPKVPITAEEAEVIRRAEEIQSRL
jgi:hypothetical protein